MRVLPVFWEWQLTNKTRVGLSAIAALWANLASGAAAKSRSARIRSAAARAASHSASFAATTSATLSKAATFSISSAASASTTSYAFNKAHLADAVTLSHSATANITHPSAFWSAIRADCIALLAGGDPHLLPLWPAENPLAEQWSTIRTHPSTQSPGWRFWIDWYERALTGQPQDWALLEKIALIDPTDWDKGEDHLNPLILQMVEQHALLLETRRLKAENERLVEHLRALEQRSHNNPPELVDDLAPVRTGTTIIWAALNDAERELGKAKPDRGALRKAADALLTASKAIGGYCLRLADTMAQGAARTAGATIFAGLGIAGLLSNVNADLATLAEDLLRFAASLLP